MRHLVTRALTSLVLVACGGAQQPAPTAPDAPAAPEAAPKPEAGTATGAADEPAPSPTDSTKKGGTGDAGTFDLKNSTTAKEAHGVGASKLSPTKDTALLKFIVVDKDKGPLSGIVVSLTAPDGQKYYTEETDTAGYAEVLVPVGKKYELVYLSLGRRDVAATVPVTDEPNQNIKLTLRYKRERPLTDTAPRFVLDGINFDTAKATIRPESFATLDRVVDYMAHKKSSRIEISGHTDNVGKPAANKKLSQARADACRTYLISKGIDGSRIEAKGFGEERPIAPNDTAEGRQKNRRIEATEL